MTTRTSRAPRALRVGAVLLAPAALCAGLLAPPAQAHDGHHRHHRSEPVTQLAVPQVFGHRGAAGYRPEHTLAAYRLGIALGADYIEPDLVSTKDHVLVARHENDITGTTDVAEHPEFADRRTTKSIDGVEHTGWFTEDFTLAELKTLRAVERLPEDRPRNTRYDGRFQVPTFAEVLALVKAEEKRLHTTIGVAPETKHPTYFDSIGLSLEEPMLADLRAARMDDRRSKVLLQSFEVSNLRELDRRTRLPLEQLLSATGAPYDQVVAGTGVTYADLTTRRGLRRVSRYADWIGPDKTMVLPVDPTTGATTRPSRLVPRAHRAGLYVVIYTIRDENQFMATNFRRGTAPNAFGDEIGRAHV